jgi:hypothetical protein
MNFMQRSSDVKRTVALPGGATPQQQLARLPVQKAALFVAHGMGQQIPFETMDAVAEGLARYLAVEKGSPIGAIRAATVSLGDEKLQRIEMKVPLPKDGGSLELHIYEGYWAPVTEGQVRLSDVISFLLRGGINGVRNSLARFYRWIFGESVSFGWRPLPALWLGTALLFVLSLVVVNFIVTVVFAGRLLGSIAGPGAGSTIDDTMTLGMTTLVGGWVAVTAVLGALLYLVHLGKPRLAWNVRAPGLNRLRDAWGALLTGIGWLLWLPLALWLAATIALGIALVGAVFGLFDVRHYGAEFFHERTPEVWAMLLLVSAIVHRLLIQYPGDVAAYVATHTLDRFEAIREEIKRRIGTVAKAIYGCHDYQAVLWVGHSLGSVVAYDALNAIITDDELADRPDKVVERTRLFVTFGSPLDKTAFIFASQWGNTTETREALAASLQPLILDYALFRRFPWVNLYSRSDVISGRLDFYDIPLDKAPPDVLRVVNRVDRRASTPLFAHVEYWNNPGLFKEIYEGLAQA